MDRYDTSSRHPATTWLILTASWYLLSALTIPSLLQASTVGFLMLAAALVFRRRQFVQAWQQTRLVWLLIGLALLTGTVNSGQLDKSVLGLYEAVRGFLLFFALFALLVELPPAALRTSAGYFFSALALLLLLVFLFLVAQGDTFDLRNNPVLLQHIGNLHEFANLTALCLLALACLYLTDADRKHILLLPVALVSIVLLATTSRGNWIAVGLGLLYLLMQKRHLRLWWLLVTVFLLGYVFIMFLDTGTFTASPALAGTIGIRRDLYNETLAQFLQEPWFGHGINTFKYSSGLLNPSGEAYIMPHNIYLGMLYAWGLAGSLLFAPGLVALFSCRPAGRPDSFLFPFGSVLLIWLSSRGLLDMKFYSYHFIGLIACAAAFVRLSCLHQNTSEQPL